MSSQPTQQQQPADTSQQKKPWSDELRWQGLRVNVNIKAGTAQSDDKRTYVDSWYWQMVNAGRQSDRFKAWYYASVTLTAVAAVTVPTLIAFTQSTDTFTAKVLRIVAAALGVLVAGATTLLGVVEVGNRWRLYRTFAQALEEAGWDYLTSDKEDDKDGRRYKNFVNEVDHARKAFGRGYLNQIAVLSQAPPANVN